jgi:hypothetical protein
MRWRREAGLTGRPEPVKTVKPSRRRENAYLVAPVDRASRDTSRAGDAAEYLRRYGPVYRCDVKGRANPRADYWMRGSTVLTDNDIIERAERNGWKPDLWREIPTHLPTATGQPGVGAAHHARPAPLLGAAA